MAENPTDNGVGLLTAGHRDLWAEARQLLRQGMSNYLIAVNFLNNYLICNQSLLINS